MVEGCRHCAISIDRDMECHVYHLVVVWSLANQLFTQRCSCLDANMPISVDVYFHGELILGTADFASATHSLSVDMEIGTLPAIAVNRCMEQCVGGATEVNRFSPGAVTDCGT